MHTTMHQRKNKCIIIGGGAAGLAAACYLSRYNIEHLILEKNDKLGKKLYATGNGRCNILNLKEGVYFGEENFAKDLLFYMPQLKVKEFLESLGLLIGEEEDGRAYPLVKRADCVVDCLKQGIKGDVKLNCTVLDIEKGRFNYKVITSEGDFYAENIIIAGGGLAQKKLGGTDSLLAPLNRLGLKTIKQEPALCPIDCDTKNIKGLSGLRMTAIISLMHDLKPIKTVKGELLFTDSGLSGIAVMQLSRELNFYDNKRLSLSVDFSPLLGIDENINYGRLEKYKNNYFEVLYFLEKRQKRFSKENLLLGLFPKQLIDKLLVIGDIKKTAQNISNFSLQVKGSKGLDFAQVSTGGVLCSQIDPQTMESPLKGLYIAGEILNVDGDCGGYNLLFAFAGGLAAAKSIVNKGA